MKKILLFLLFPLHMGVAQDIMVCDSMAQVLCEHVSNSKITDDSTRLVKAYDDVLMPYLNQLPPEMIHPTGERIYQRFWRNCESIAAFLWRLEPPQNGMTIAYEKPQANISKKDIKAFKKLPEINYVETTGSKTVISFAKDDVREKFSDGTYTKLSMKWTADNEFELTFLESNNEQRNNYSIKGDTYAYQLLNVGEGFYEMSMNIPGQQIYNIFKVYFDE